MNKLSAKFDTRVNILLSTKIAWEEIERIADLAQKLNLTLAFNPLCPSGRADSSYLMGPEEYFDWMYRLEDLRQRNIRIRKNFDLKGPYLYENEQCPVRKGDAIHVHADGSVYPCGFLVNLPECFMGSVREKSLAELVNTIPQDCQALANLCINCPFFNQGYCHGGCPARIYALNHRFDRVDIYCLAEYFQEKSK